MSPKPKPRPEQVDEQLRAELLALLQEEEGWDAEAGPDPRYWERGALTDVMDRGGEGGEGDEGGEGGEGGEGAAVEERGRELEECKPQGAPVEE